MVKRTDQYCLLGKGGLAVVAKRMVTNVRLVERECNATDEPVGGGRPERMNMRHTWFPLVKPSEAPLVTSHEGPYQWG